MEKGKKYLSTVTTHESLFVIDIYIYIYIHIYIHNTINVWTIVRPEYSTWRFIFTILPYYSTALNISKIFHILSSFNENEMGSDWVLFLLYLDALNAELNPFPHLLSLLGAHHILHVSRVRVNIVHNWPEDGRLRSKDVAK